MAKEQTEQAVEATDVPVTGVPAGKGRSGLLLVIIGGVALIGVSVALTLLAARFMRTEANPDGEGASGAKKTGEGEKSAHGEKKTGEGEKSGHGAKKGEGEGESSSLNVDIKDMFVNIPDTKGMRVLKIRPMLVASEFKMKEYLVANEPMVRDRVGMAVARLSLEDLDGARGRENLKREIIALINEAVKERANGGVVDVFLADLVIQ